MNPSRDWMLNPKTGRLNAAGFWHNRREIVSALALGSPNPWKTLKLYVHEKKGIGSVVLVQVLGDSPQPTAYFSKRVLKQHKGGHFVCRQLQLPVSSYKKHKNNSRTVSDGVCTTPTPGIVRMKGRVMDNNWANEPIPGYFTRQS